jgi:hypothetical protein
MKQSNSHMLLLILIPILFSKKVKQLIEPLLYSYEETAFARFLLNHILHIYRYLPSLVLEIVVHIFLN